MSYGIILKATEDILPKDYENEVRNDWTTHPPPRMPEVDSGRTLAGT